MAMKELKLLEEELAVLPKKKKPTVGVADASWLSSPQRRKKRRAVRFGTVTVISHPPLGVDVHHADRSIAVVVDLDLYELRRMRKYNNIKNCWAALMRDT